jgi:hypothetical protein
MGRTVRVKAAGSKAKAAVAGKAEAAMAPLVNLMNSRLCMVLVSPIRCVMHFKVKFESRA